MWRDSGGTGETRGAESAAGSGTWPTNAEERRLKQKGSREGGCKRIGRNR